MTQYNIKEVGLPTFLDRTRHMHRGLGWSDFKQRLDMGVSKKKIAADFGLSRTRLYYWLEILKDENRA